MTAKCNIYGWKGQESEKRRRRRGGGGVGIFRPKTGTSWHDHQWWSTLIFKCPDLFICASTKAWHIDASSALNKEILLVLVQI